MKEIPSEKLFNGSKMYLINLSEDLRIDRIQRYHG